MLTWLQNAQLAARTQEQLQAVQQEVQEAQHKADQVRTGCWRQRRVLRLCDAQCIPLGQSQHHAVLCPPALAAHRPAWGLWFDRYARGCQHHHSWTPFDHPRPCPTHTCPHNTLPHPLATLQLEAALEATRHQAESLSRQAADTSAELTAAKVAGESAAGKVSALESQLRELQLVAEKKLLAASQEAEAALYHAELAAQQAQAALQVGAAGVAGRWGGTGAGQVSSLQHLNPVGSRKTMLLLLLSCWAVCIITPSCKADE